MMKTYEFSIIASGLDPSAEDFESRFYEAGCEDATISFQKGHIIVDFAREAESVGDAISSAIDGVLTAGASVDRVVTPEMIEAGEKILDQNLGAQGSRWDVYPKELIREILTAALSFSPR